MYRSATTKFDAVDRSTDQTITHRDWIHVTHQQLPSKSIPFSSILTQKLRVIEACHIAVNHPLRPQSILTMNPITLKTLHTLVRRRTARVQQIQQIQQIHQTHQQLLREIEKVIERERRCPGVPLSSLNR
jgi:hypothetical protein